MSNILWHDFKTAQPEHEGFYLLTVRDENGFRGVDTDHWIEGYTGTNDSVWSFLYYTNDEVLAWAEIPAPFERKEDHESKS